MSESVFGIDLGTTFCAAARIEVNGSEPTIVRLDNQHQSLASVVLLRADDDGKQVHVGRDAYRKWGARDTLVEFAKRYIGRPKEESNSWHVGGQEFDPVDISALILRKIMQGIHYDRDDDRAPVRAVVTHPRDFHQMQKQATADAVVAAGLDLIETLNEPEAASYMYFEPGADRIPGKYMVFDLGGGTLDIAILDVPAKGRPRIIGGHGISQLGGKDWDDELFKAIIDAVHDHHQGRVDVRRSASALTLMTWRQKAREWKEKRGNKKAWQEELRWRTTDGDEVVTPVTIPCHQWERACEGLVSHCEETVYSALRDANVTQQQIVRVLPVGGSMRLKMVQVMLDRLFGNRVDRIDGPGAPSLDTVVAEGAARYAAFHAADAVKATLSPFETARLAEIEDSIPVSTLAHGINVLTVTPGGAENLSAVVPQNTPLPCKREKPFRVVDDYALTIHVYEGPAGPKPAGCLPSAELTFPSHIRPRQGETVVVEVEVTHSGRIHVRAHYEDEKVVEGELHAVRTAGSSDADPGAAGPHKRRKRLAGIAVF